MRKTLTVLTFILGATVVIAAAKITVERKPEFDFATLKTWAWNPSGPGDVKVWISANSKSEPVKRTYEPVIVQAVESELARQGRPLASGGPADFVVTYYMLITVGSQSQQMGQFLPSTLQFGVPPFAPATTSLSVYPQGTLVLDVAAPDAQHVVWRAVAQAEVELDRTDAERADRLRKVIRDIVKKLPKK